MYSSQWFATTDVVSGLYYILMQKKKTNSDDAVFAFSTQTHDASSLDIYEGSISSTAMVLLFILEWDTD